MPICEFYVEKLVEAFPLWARRFWPKPVIVRLSDSSRTNIRV